jgi:hypothetical protein
MVVRILLMILRLIAVITLILGILMWLKIAQPLVGLHMLLGLLVVLVLWLLGGIIVTKGARGLGLGAFVLGLVVALVGLYQQTLIPLAGKMYGIIQVIHLLLGLCAIGWGEMIGTHYKGLQVESTKAEP